MSCITEDVIFPAFQQHTVDEYSLIIDIGTSSNVVGRAGGSVKYRIFESKTGDCVFHFPTQKDFLCGDYASLSELLAGASPSDFFERIATHVHRNILVHLSAGSHLRKVVVGFPAVIVGGVAPKTANLVESSSGDGSSWVDTNVRKLVANAFSIDDSRVLVVNDMVAGIAGFVERRRSLKIGDHMAYICIGGGCGVSEAFVLSDKVLLKPTELGHMCAVPRRAYEDGAVLACASRQQSTLEAAFCSTGAIERLYFDVMRRNVGVHKILDSWEGGALGAGDVVIDRVLEGLAILGTQLAMSGVRLIVIAGHLTSRLSRGCILNYRKSLVELVSLRMQLYCREDILRVTEIIESDSRDNTEARVLFHEQAVVSETSGWVEIPLEVCKRANCESPGRG